MKPQSVVVTLSGKSGSGKDTVADIIDRKYGHRFCRYAFADSLKKTIATMFDLDAKIFYDTSLKNKKLDCYPFKSPRELMNDIGTDLFRKHYDENVWANITAKKIEKDRKYWELLYKHTNGGVPCSYYMITDLRFVNEAKVLSGLIRDDHNDKIIKVYVYRPDNELAVAKAGDTDVNQMESENSIPDRDSGFFDRIIVNDGNIFDLEKKVIEFIKDISEGDK